MVICAYPYQGAVELFVGPFEGGIGFSPATARELAVQLLNSAALAESPELEGFGGRVSDSGEGRWTVLAAIDEGVPVPVLSSALFERFESRGEADFADKLLSALRKEFGGHVELAPPATGR